MRPIGSCPRVPVLLAALAAAVAVAAACAPRGGEAAPPAPPGIDDPVTPPPSIAGPDLPPPPAPLPVADAAGAAGVAQVALSNRCTGVLVDTGVPSGPAYLLTAGHCAGGQEAGPNAVVVDRPVEQQEASFGRVLGGPPPVGVPVVRTVWASMKHTDLAVVELEGTLGEQMAAGRSGYRLAAPQPGSSVVNVGIPVQTIVDEADWVLRRSTCTVAEPVPVVEWRWSFGTMWAVDCPGVLGGHSGSPLFDGEGRVVALLTTTTLGAPDAVNCGLGEPCEVTGDDVTFRRGRSYAVPVSGVAACVGADGQFSLGGACPLDPGGGVQAFGPLALSRTAKGAPTSWAVPVEGPVGVTLLAKSGPLPTTSCTDAGGYAAVGRFGDDRSLLLQRPVPTRDGFHVLCLVPEGRPTQEAAASLLRVDSEPPRIDPQLARFGELATGISVEPFFQPPELSDFLVAHGPVGQVDCATVTYERFRRVPVELPPGRRSHVCVIGIDEAGNEGRPVRIAVP